MPDLRSLAPIAVTILLSGAASAESGSASQMQIADLDSRPANSRSADWVEVASESPEDPRSGYRVFERSMAGSQYKAYRIEALLSAPPERANAAARLRILDERFVGSGRERRVVGRDGDALILYFRTGAPMIDDRDAVTRLEPLHSADGSLGWQWKSTEAGPAPVPNVVRMSRSDGSWRFHSAGPRRSHAVYESHSELGGSIPTWVINRLMVGEQLRELETLRSVLASHDDRGLRAALNRVERATPSVDVGPAH